ISPLHLLLVCVRGFLVSFSFHCPCPKPQIHYLVNRLGNYINRLGYYWLCSLRSELYVRNVAIIYFWLSRTITGHVSVYRGQRQITEQNSTHACLTGAIPNFIIFDRMKNKLVVNTITEFARYWSGNSRVT